MDGEVVTQLRVLAKKRENSGFLRVFPSFIPNPGEELSLFQHSGIQNNTIQLARVFCLNLTVAEPGSTYLLSHGQIDALFVLYSAVPLQVVSRAYKSVFFAT